jgi:hypothetical protein
MLAIAAWCERCSECHSEAQGSITCAICSRGSRASSRPGIKLVPGRLLPHEWEKATFARFVKMSAIAALCERCRECHSEAQGSIACAICSRGSRASLPGGTAIMGKVAEGTPYTAAGGKTNILSFSAKPENDEVEATQVCAVRPWHDNSADDCEACVEHSSVSPPIGHNMI